MKLFMFSFITSFTLTMANSFDFTAVLDSLKNQNQVKPYYIAASDGIKLAVYPHMPTSPQAIVIFYHGGGIWSGSLYQSMAHELMERGVGVYLVDIRGHGNSGGPRGDAPSTERVWDDISTVIEYVRQNHPRSKLFLGGHSSGAGLVLNYSSYKSRKMVDGYVFLAPALGPYAGVARTDLSPEQKFVKQVRLFPLIIHNISRGWLYAHTPAVFFNYPSWLKQEDQNVLDFYTCSMALATTPMHEKNIFQNLDKPFVLYIGQYDEQFIPEATIEYAKFSSQSSVVGIIPDQNHLSIVLKAPEILVQALEKI